MDGTTLVFNGKSALTSNPAATIHLNERAEPVSMSAQVWTGTLQDGTAAVYRCEEWTSSPSQRSGAAGSTASTTASWTAHLTVRCNEPHTLYRFEQ